MTTYHILVMFLSDIYVTVTDPWYSSSETIYVGQVNNPAINSNVISNVNCFIGSDAFVTVTQVYPSISILLNGVPNKRSP